MGSARVHPGCTDISSVIPDRWLNLSEPDTEPRELQWRNELLYVQSAKQGEGEIIARKPWLPDGLQTRGFIE